MTQALANVQYKPTEMTTERLGAVMVKSGFFQDAKDEAQAIVKILAGAELGLGPIASMQGIYIVKGRFTLAANLIAAVIQRSGKYRYRVTHLDNESCSIIFYSGGNELGESTFTIDDAKTAGLISDTYRKFPRNMLFSRALTNGARWYTPDVFNGPVYTPDELGEQVDDDGRVVEVQAAPRAVPTRERDVEDRATLQRGGAIAQEALEDRFGGPEPAPAVKPQKAPPSREVLAERYGKLVEQATEFGIPLDPDTWGIGQDTTAEEIAKKGAELKYMIYGDSPKPQRAA